MFLFISLCICFTSLVNPVLSKLLRNLFQYVYQGLKFSLGLTPPGGQVVSNCYSSFFQVVLCLTLCTVNEKKATKNTFYCVTLFIYTATDYYSRKQTYRIQPNHRTVRLGFSNLQDTLICGQICIYLLRLHYKKDQKRTYLMMTMRFFLTFFTKAYVVGTHLNCIDLSMQFK